jgi:Zn-dependent protease/CBS domain-containing protein
MRGSFRLGRISGIEIMIHYSWIIIFILVATTLAMGVFPQAAQTSQAMAWLAGIIAAMLLFVSVLIHELAHSLVAQARGMRVRSITLFILGGVSNIEEEAKKPGIEFSMAIVGPLSSIILAGVFWVFFAVAQGTGSTIGFPAPQYRSLGAAMLHYLAYVNLILGAFNLLPGFPLDGGRVLRSVVWASTGNLVRATNIAATVGRLFGWGLMAIGVLNILGRRILIFPPGLGGIWIGIIGWFLTNAADTSRSEVTVREQLAGVKVKDAMVQYRENATPRMTVDELVRGIMNQRFSRAVPVCDDSGTVGIVTIGDVKVVPQDQWATTTVDKVMTRSPIYSVTPEDDLNKAMSLIAQHDLNQVLVMDGGQCAGLLSRAEVIRYIQLAQELRIRNKPDQQQRRV